VIGRLERFVVVWVAGRDGAEESVFGARARDY